MLPTGKKQLKAAFAELHIWEMKRQKNHELQLVDFFDFFYVLKYTKKIRH